MFIVTSITLMWSPYVSLYIPMIAAMALPLASDICLK